MYLLLLCLTLQLLDPTGASNSGIRGGKAAKPHSRPYMVSLQSKGYHVCGGLLIRKDFVLTSAHCIKYKPLEVVLGAHNISKHETTQQRIQVGKFHPHTSYLNANQCDYDVMLLKLKTKAKLNKYVKVIGLPRKDGNIPANIKCSVAGWGQKRSGGHAEGVLQEVTQTIEKNAQCKSFWQKYFFNKQMICTRSERDRGFCQGDSGGPIICNKKPQGIAAYNNGCNESKYPDVYMKIPFFVPWINKTIEGYN
ncbi:granzyme B-like isoform X1 [Anguilla rostrata]|uniref:granzyme B-like isoform X1 n=2 Tax=Anguilla rostrata TaxID=7938 RepID=UPI0030CFA2B9